MTIENLGKFHNVCYSRGARENCPCPSLDALLWRAGSTSPCWQHSGEWTLCLTKTAPRADLGGGGVVELPKGISVRELTLSLIYHRMAEGCRGDGWVQRGRHPMPLPQEHEFRRASPVPHQLQLGKAGPESHLDSTVELALVEGLQVSQPQG